MWNKSDCVNGSERGWIGLNRSDRGQIVWNMSD